MIASLPMYDLPEIRSGTDQLWAAIRDTRFLDGIDAPEDLTRDQGEAETLNAPNLLLGQTCSLPFRLWVHRNAVMVGAFDYDLPDTPPGSYHSVYVAHGEDPRSAEDAFNGARPAYISGGSQSGWGTPWSENLGLEPKLETGAQIESIRAVTQGQADVASIDAAT